MFYKQRAYRRGHYFEAFVQRAYQGCLPTSYVYIRQLPKWFGSSVSEVSEQYSSVVVLRLFEYHGLEKRNTLEGLEKGFF